MLSAHAAALFALGCFVPSVARGRGPVLENTRHYLLLDMHDDGFDLSGRNPNTSTRWTKVMPDDGFLAVDVTALRAAGVDMSTSPHTRGDGVVIVSSELRVSIKGQSKDAGNCWQLLSMLDANRDGKLDGKDPSWGALRIFIDRNGDGSVSSREVLTTAEANLRDIAVSVSSARNERIDNHGNVLVDGAFSPNDGSTRRAADVLFARAPEAEGGVAFR